MSLRFTDSFDHYATANLLQKWTSITTGSDGSVSIGAGGRFGSGMFLGAGFPYVGWATKILDAQATWYVGAAFSPFGRIILYDGATAQLTLALDGTGRLAVYQGTTSGTLLGTGTTILSPGWHYVELGATINNTTGTCEVRLDGVTEWSGSALDTQASANASADRVTLWGQNGVAVDDLYICDGAGSAPRNTFLGDVRVQALMPSADGDLSQFVPSSGSTHYNLVDEVPPDDDTSYVSSATAGNVDLYQLGDVAAVSGSILGLQVLPYARKDDAGTRTLAPVVKTGGVEYDGSAVALGMSYTYLPEIWEQNPATSADWTIADVNALQAGVKVVA